MRVSTNDMFKDSFGRIHNYLRISLTEQCNLRCTYCMPAEGIPVTPAVHLMSDDEVVEIASYFVKHGVTKIRLTGGEPLVRKGVRDLILRLGKLGVELTITTNALLVHRYITVFKDAGIHSLNVSLDTLKEDRFVEMTRRKGYRKTRENIQLLLDEGFRVKLNAVVMRNTNEDEILDFVALTREQPLHVRFIEFMPFEGNEWKWDKIFSYKEMLEIIQAKYEVKKLEDKRHATTKAWQVDGFKGTFAVISSMTEHFCGSCNRLRLTANGKLKNCLFSNKETDLLTPFRKGEELYPIIMQNVQKKAFKHGGIKSLETLTNDHPDMSERSMILIGG